MTAGRGFTDLARGLWQAQRVRHWVRRHLGLGTRPLVMVAGIPCVDPACPGPATAISVLGLDLIALRWTVHKPVADIREADIAALMGGTGPLRQSRRCYRVSPLLRSSMARRAASLLTRLTVTLALVALVGLGAAHRHHPASEPAIAALLLAGGSLAELCLEGDGDAPGHYGDCPACTLGKTLSMAATGPMPGPAHRLVGTAPLQPRAAPTPAHPPRAPPARGPPAALA